MGVGGEGGTGGRGRGARGQLLVVVSEWKQDGEQAEKQDTEKEEKDKGPGAAALMEG